MVEILALWSMFSALLDDVDVEALLAHRREEIRALEVHVDGEGWIFDSCDPGAPAVIMLRIEHDRFVVGEPQTTPLSTTSLGALRREIETLKDRRKDRESVLIDVGEAVSYATVVAVVDILAGTELRQIAVLSTPKTPALEVSNWVVPTFPPRKW